MEGESANNRRQVRVRTGAGVTKWAAECKATRKQCRCYACREGIEHRSVRVRSAANAGATLYWFHPACIEGGLGPFWRDFFGADVPRRAEGLLRPTGHVQQG